MKKLMIGIIVLVIGVVVFAQSSSVVPYISSYIRTLLNDSNAATARTTLGAEASGTAASLIATHNNTTDHNNVGTALQPEDINNTDYGDWMIDNITEIISSDKLHDKIETVIDGTIGFTSSDSIDFTIIDGNLVPDVNNTWFANNVPTGTDVNDLITLSGLPANSTDYGTMFTGSTIPTDSNLAGALQALETAVEAGSGGIWSYYSFSILDPNSYYNTSVVFPIDVNLGNDITIAQVITSCDKVPTAELDLDLKYADNKALTGATLVVALDTTNGESTKTTGFNDATVASTKWLYLQFGEQPPSDIDFVSVSVKYSTLDGVLDYFSKVIVEPNEVYDVNATFPVYEYMEAAATIDQLIIECDVNPTTESNITFYYADSLITKANPVQMCNITLTDGAATIESFDDGTVPVGKVVYGVFNARPDAALNWIAIKGRKALD